MEDRLTAIEIALLVLKAINEKRHPDPVDAESLRRLEPMSSHVPLDELACDVIQQALARRKLPCRALEAVAS
jgi:hypothetical protein